MTTTTALPAFTERHCRTIQRILEQMDRSAQRAELQYSRQRKHERKPYRGPLSLFFSKDEQDSPPECGSEDCIPAWSYSLSQGGVGLITLEETQQNYVWVGVHLPNQILRWMQGRIVRRREIPEEEFFDYGICFLVKSSEPDDEAE